MTRPVRPTYVIEFEFELDRAHRRREIYANRPGPDDMISRFQVDQNPVRDRASHRRTRVRPHPAIVVDDPLVPRKTALLTRGWGSAAGEPPSPRTPRTGT